MKSNVCCYNTMTIADINSLPVIRVNITGRSFTSLAAKITNQETKKVHTFAPEDVVYWFSNNDSSYVNLTITDSTFQSEINSNSTLSVNIYNSSDSSPVYRDIVTFRTSLASTSDYVQDNSDYEYIFV